MVNKNLIIAALIFASILNTIEITFGLIQRNVEVEQQKDEACKEYQSKFDLLITRIF